MTEQVSDYLTGTRKVPLLGTVVLTIEEQQSRIHLGGDPIGEGKKG